MGEWSRAVSVRVTCSTVRPGSLYGSHLVCHFPSQTGRLNSGNTGRA